MITYSQLSFAARAQLSHEDPKRFQQLKQEHAARVASIETQLRSAKSWDDRRRTRAELEALGQPGTATLAQVRAEMPASSPAKSVEEQADAAQEAAYRANPHLRPKAGARYEDMSFPKRAALAREAPRTFAALKRDHQQRLDALETQLARASTLAERQQLRNQIVAMTSPGSNPMSAA